MNKLDLNKDEYLLKYLYYDIYNVEADNPKEIYDNLLTLAQNDISKIYDGIKKINLELKK